MVLWRLEIRVLLVGLVPQQVLLLRQVLEVLYFRVLRQPRQLLRVLFVPLILEVLGLPYLLSVLEARYSLVGLPVQQVQWVQ